MKAAKVRGKLTRYEIDLLREMLDDLLALGMAPMTAYRALVMRFEAHAAAIS